MKRSLLWAAAFGASTLASASSDALHHLIKVRQVFAGTAGNPGAQFIQLLIPGGQSQTNGDVVRVYGASGALLGSVTMPVGIQTASQGRPYFLIATTQAEQLFGITADLKMSPVLALGGGRVCYASFDCVAWGPYTGSTSLNSPFEAVASPSYLTVPLSRALSRTSDDYTQDTNLSANWMVGLPAGIQNNAGQSGTLPSSCDNDGLVDGLEQCDDAGADVPGCASCTFVACTDDDGGGPRCNDGDTDHFDDCKNDCTEAACGDAILAIRGAPPRSVRRR